MRLSALLTTTLTLAATAVTALAFPPKFLNARDSDEFTICYTECEYDAYACFAVDTDNPSEW